MSRHTLEDWLAWQETLHPAGIALGLDRVGEVGRRLDVLAPAQVVITIAGTNGKGSTTALLEAMLAAAGYRVGTYTSPHLLRYNERVRIRLEEASDEALCEAFSRIDAARGDIPLTYFEFGTLAALDLFSRAALDVVLLEVGMGGRLDAVNVVTPDVAIVTSVALDHCEWLGPDREAIGREKAGIFREGRCAVCADPGPPASLVEAARAVGARLLLVGRDFDAQRREAGEWSCRIGGTRIDGLPPPALAGGFQYRNAAAAIAALHCLDDRLPVSHEALARGLRNVRVMGRFQQLSVRPEVFVDVAHNPESAAALAGILADLPHSGRVVAVFAALGDKDIEGIVAPLADCFGAWHIAGLPDVARAMSGASLASRVAAHLAVPVTAHADVDGALDAAVSGGATRIVVFGSFHTVGAAMIRHERLQSQGDRL